MLYPRENEVCAVSDLSGIWNFYPGNENEPGAVCEDLADMGKTELIAVPASYNDQKDDPAFRRHYGWAYYQRRVTVPACYAGQRTVLR